MLLSILFFYSILLISNNFYIFLFIKIVFYILKYIFKYLFLSLDYLIYTYKNFSRMPTIIWGIPYYIIIKLMLFNIYKIIFEIFPLLIYIGY